MNIYIPSRLIRTLRGMIPQTAMKLFGRIRQQDDLAQIMGYENIPL